ncbi:MAG: helix-turn-helix domain-containing protein [Halobacteriota archaeon]
MKDVETKLKCFELRAQGKSYHAIAKEVGVRRQTVADWLSEHAEEVANYKSMELDALREACRMTKHARIESLRARYEQITAELDKRDFSDVPTAKLIELEIKTRTELADELGDRPVRSVDELKKAKAQRVAVDERAPWDGDNVELLLDADDDSNGQQSSRRSKNTGTRSG